MNNSSQLVWSWDGEPFGATPANGSVSPVTTFTYNLRFPGQYYDQETGYHQNRWREYDPKQGKYLQSDPLGLAAGVNTYAYVDSSPLMFIDPLGLDHWGNDPSLKTAPESVESRDQWISWLKEKYGYSTTRMFEEAKKARSSKNNNWASDLNLRNAEHYCFSQYLRSEEGLGKYLGTSILVVSIPAWSIYKQIRWHSHIKAWATTEPTYLEFTSGFAGTFKPQKD